MEENLEYTKRKKKYVFLTQEEKPNNEGKNETL